MQSSRWSVDVSKWMPYGSSLKHSNAAEDIFDLPLDAARDSYWKHFISNRAQMSDTFRLTEAIEALRGFQGWATDRCQDVTTQSTMSVHFSTKISLYVAIVMNKGAHFIVDQLATVMQLRELSDISKIYVSIVEYGKNEDQGSFLLDLVEGTLLMADISYTLEQLQSRYSLKDTYYPQVEAELRNLALVPLMKMKKQRFTYDRVVWLRGFTCPVELLTMVKTSYRHNASMVCGTDWRVEGDRLVFLDVWRTRDIEGRTFRKVASKLSTGLEFSPVREPISAKRFQGRHPFQVFCCEGGSHVVDPSATYYQGLTYTVEDPDKSIKIDENTPCMDSAQMHFCRDIWLKVAQDSAENKVRTEYRAQNSKLNISPATRRTLLRELVSDAQKLRTVMTPASILMHPGCLTTYADGSHAQLVSDFAASIEQQEVLQDNGDNLQLRQAPSSYLCLEMTTRGGREVPKTQRWTRFNLADRLQRWAQQL